MLPATLRLTKQPICSRLTNPMQTTEKTAPSRLPSLPQLDGILVLNKPAGPTSARCLTMLKKLGQKKIGHAGTLDPMASGVLLVLLGQATKLSSHLMAGGRKVYSGRILLGAETDTWDIQGNLVAERSWAHIDPAEVGRAIRGWKEERSQEVPPYSAAKHQGQPLYRLARRGLETPVKIREINVYEADMPEIGMPFASFRVACGSGAYIRSLAHSLGKRLGCGATLWELTREYSHPFGLDQAHSPDEILARPDNLPAMVLPLSAALPEWTRVELGPEEAGHARNGRPVPARGDPRCQQAILYCGDKPLALATLAGKDWKVTRGLWT